MDSRFQKSSYAFDLPDSFIAQEPTPARDESKLLAVDCRKDTFSDRSFSEIIDYFQTGDLLIMNNTKVFPARLYGRKSSGGKVEVLLLQYPRTGSKSASKQEIVAPALLKCSKRPQKGSVIIFSEHFKAFILSYSENGEALLRLIFDGDLAESLGQHGVMPLPPYIRRDQDEETGDRERYQTVYASKFGAIAAPTAGLHFTDTLLSRLKDKGIDITFLTLHVGYGTFAPVRVEDIRQHAIHQEYIEISKATAAQINAAKSSGNRIWVVGTTTARALEYATDEEGYVSPTKGMCDLYIYPGYTFRTVQNLITNFHLPGSSLLFLVCALGGRERIMASYRHAISKGYRFYSYGDAMAIITK